MKNIEKSRDVEEISSLALDLNSGCDLPITYSRFESRTDVTPVPVTEPFFSFAERCSKPVIRDEKDGPAFCAATFYPAYRNAQNANECSFLTFDLDNLPEDTTTADVLDCVSGMLAFTYTTHSHRLPAKGARFRVVIAVSKPISAADYKAVSANFARRFETLSGVVDTSGFTASQLMYFPSCPEGMYGAFEFDGQEGEPFDWKSRDCNPRNGQMTPNRNDLTVICDLSREHRNSKILIQEGSRNRELFDMGASMRGRGMERDQIVSQLLEKNAELCVTPLTRHEVLTIAESVCRYPRGNVSASTDSNTGLVVHNDMLTVTELGLAREVMQAHCGNFHYVVESGKWIICNPITNVWREDSSGQVMRWFLERIKKRGEYAAELIARGEYEYGQKVLAGVKKAEKHSFINGAQSFLKSLDGVPIHKREFDANPYVVGFRGGLCADLKTLTVRAIQPEDNLTKLCGVEYRADATCPQWDKSILEWCCGDIDMARFLQVWVGYCLSGLTDQQYFLFLFGGGRNGKSVFVDILSSLMSDYALTMNPDSLMLKSNGSGVNNDIARLAGARLVTSVELQEGRVFDENLIKQLTGGDIITARYLYQENFEFHANLKLMVTGNHKPIVKGTDFGFWRRVLMVPFFANVANPDPDLKNKLRAELSGILNWALDGWRIYRDEGLVIPKAIHRESTEYKNEMDFVGQWLKQCTTAIPGNEIRGAVLYQSFKRWVEENGFICLNSSAFGRKMSSAGVRSRRDSKGTIYLDLQLAG